MRLPHLVFRQTLCLFIGLVFPAMLFAQKTSIPKTIDQLVIRHQQLIVLGSYDVLPAPYSQEEVTVLGLQLMHANYDATQLLFEQLRRNPKALTAFLDFLEKPKNLWDVDRLVFEELLIQLTEEQELREANRIAEDYNDLQKIKALYAEEIKAVFGKVAGRGLVIERKRWEEYLAQIREKHSLKSIFKAHEDLHHHHDGHGSFDRSRAGKEVLFGYQLPPKTLVLTFDDGPHYSNTPAILEILEERQIPAIFFQVGENVGRLKEGAYNPTSSSKYSQKIVSSDQFLIGNHSVSHQLLSKLDSTEMVTEIDGCFQAIESVTGKKTTLFRPPYGGVNKQVKAYLKSRDSKVYLWNVDSRDWADPLPASIASRVVTEVEKQGRGVILLHDIHRKSVEALPLMLDTLLDRGYRFVLWDGNEISDALASTEPRGEASAQAPANNNLYNNQWALVIGVNEYEQWPKLQYAVNDAEGVADMLHKKLGFPKEQVLTLTNEQATRANILKMLGSKLADPSLIKEDDAVFIFFAGHGMTKSLPRGQSKGYILPVDAEYESYVSKAISMTEIQDLNEMIPAKHVFWVMDACYSGLALTRSGNVEAQSSRYIREVTNRWARQVITAGGADEEVADGGPNGHSIFTWTLLNGLSGDADLNNDGFITASEIYNYVPPLVSSMSKQTPAFGSFVGSAGGDFVLTLLRDEEALSEASDQHSDAAVSLMNEIATLRAQLADMQSKLDDQQRSESKKAETETPAESTAQKIRRLNNEGLDHFRKKDYDGAANRFEQIIQLSPKDVQAVNNLGFVYYKQQKYEQAEEYILRALEIQPNRGVAILNLADVQLETGSTEEAIKNYETYLGMMKPSEFTRSLRQKVDALKKK